jgi:hypothetical protein
MAAAVLRLLYEFISGALAASEGLIERIITGEHRDTVSSEGRRPRNCPSRWDAHSMKCGGVVGGAHWPAKDAGLSTGAS